VSVTYRRQSEPLWMDYDTKPVFVYC